MHVFLDPGLYDNDLVPHTRYHADPCERPSLSSHIASVVVSKSAGHAALVHPRLGKPSFETSDAMDIGSILHGMLLGGAADIVSVDAKDWRTNAAKEARDAAVASGKIAVLADKFARIQSAAEQVKKHLPISLATARTEVTAIWNSDGCPCRCRIDALMPDFWIWDLKFVEDATVSAADRNIAGSNYHVQAAANIDAIETLVPEMAGRVHFGLCFVEWENPAIGIMRREVRGQLLHIGQGKWGRAKDIWSKCLAEKKWPGYSSEVIEAGCPAWIASEELTAQVIPPAPF
jgi:hypothetical protein